MNKLVRLIIKLSPIIIPIVKAQLEKRAREQQAQPQNQTQTNK